MKIRKINIENFKCFKEFTLELKDINILVGNNEAGKSTILEAIHLALSGILNGRYLRNELSQYLFNIDIVNDFLTKVNDHQGKSLPYILVEIFFDGDAKPILKGNGNKDKENATGIFMKIEFDDSFKSEYKKLLEKGNLDTLPIEYYKITWKSFARQSITSRSVPLKSVMIDSSSYRYHNGSDIYIARIIKNDLDNRQKADISQAYRGLRENLWRMNLSKRLISKLKKKQTLLRKI